MKREIRDRGERKKERHTKRTNETDIPTMTTQPAVAASDQSNTEREVEKESR